MDYNWDDARLFLAVARAGKIAAASEALNLTPITVSRRIAALEARLQTLLFARHRLGVDLTGAGEEYFQIFERAEREMMRARAKADAADIGLGTVRIAATDGVGIKLIAPNLGALYAQHPSLEVELVPLSRHFSLSRREADLAVTVGRPSGDRLFAKKLCPYRLSLYASKAYIEKHGAPKSTDELADHALIGFVDDLVINNALDYTLEASRDWKNKYSIHSALGQVEAVRSGAGIGVLHDYLIEKDSDIIKLLPEIELWREYWVVTHENIRNLPRIRVAMDFLRRLVAKNTLT